MRYRDLIANGFVVAMLGLGAAVVWQWHTHRPPAPLSHRTRWIPASVSQCEQAKNVIGAQLTAFRAGDYGRAMEYEALYQRRRPHAVEDLETAVTQCYPEFADFASVEYGQAASTEAGDQLALTVTFSNDRQLQCHCTYNLTRENGRLRVAVMRPDRMFPNGVGWNRPMQPRSTASKSHLNAGEHRLASLAPK